ncbi:MAG: hypothetical protein M0000_02150 [Actinomycetota bacterium]|nr:hypothetical protein [Actinomycetota bacterium]
MTLDDLLNGARRFARGAVLAAGLSLATLAPGAGSAAEPLKAGAFSVDQVEAPAVAAHVPRRHLQRVPPIEEYAFRAVNTPDVASTIVVTNPTATDAAVSFNVGGHQVFYSVAAGHAERIPAAELGFAGDVIVYEHVTGADPSQVATFVRPGRSALENGVRAWTGSGASAIPLSDFLTSGQVAKLPLTADQHELYVIGGHDVAANGLVNLQLQVVGENGAVKKDSQGNPAQGSYTLNALTFTPIDPVAEWHITLSSGDQLIVYPFGGQVQVLDVRTLASGDELERTATTASQVDNEFDVPIMQRTAGTTPTAWTTFGAMNFTVQQGTIYLNYTDRGNGQTANAYNGSNIIGSTQSVWNDAIQDFISLGQTTAHLGASHGSMTAGSTLLPYSEIYSTTAGRTVGAVVPLFRTRDLNGPNGTRALLHALSENSDETTRIGLIDESGSPTQSIHGDCYQGSDGTKTGSFDQSITPYSNVTLDHVLTQQCGMTAPVENAYIILTSTTDNTNKQFHAWAEITSTLTGDEHVEKATKLPAPPVTGEQYVRKYLDPLFNDATPENHIQYHLEYDLSRCMLRDDCGIPNLTHDFAVILNRGIGETWTVTQFEQWLTDMTDGVVSSTNEELCTQYKPFTQGGNGTGWSLTTSPSTCTGAPGGVQLTTTDNAQAYSLVRGDVVNWVQLHPERYGGNTTTGPNLDFDPQWYTTTPR